MYKSLEKIRLQQFLKMRLHLGHKSKDLDSSLTWLIYGHRHKISIMDIEKMWIIYRHFYYSLSEMVALRQNFFFIAPQKFLNDKHIKNFIIKNFNKNNNYNSLYLSFFLQEYWKNGMITNPKITKSYLEKEIKKYGESKRLNIWKMNKRFKSISVPDLIITLKPKMEILEEASRFNVPIISVVDTNMNSSKFLYSLYMNDDSLESLSFLLELLQTAIEEGRRKEKIVFYNYFLKKIKKSYKLKNF